MSLHAIIADTEPPHIRIYLALKSFSDKTALTISKTGISSIIFCLMMLFAGSCRSETREDGAFGLTNFAFASYLGTGFYTTSGQKVFVLQLPFEYDITTKTSTKPGWRLNLPVTIGVINIDSIDTELLPDLSDFTTITFLPGIEYKRPITINWTVSPFADYGFARDLKNNSSVLVMGAGVKSNYNFSLGDQYFTLGNRFLYAREKSNLTSNNLDYTLIETGISYNRPTRFNFSNNTLFLNLYYINFYYPNNLVFLNNTKNPIRVGVEHEFGFTVSNMPNFLFFDSPQLGLGIRFGNDIKVYRLVFGVPF